MFAKGDSRIMNGGISFSGMMKKKEREDEETIRALFMVPKLCFFPYAYTFYIYIYI